MTSLGLDWCETSRTRNELGWSALLTTEMKLSKHCVNHCLAFPPLWLLQRQLQQRKIQSKVCFKKAWDIWRQYTVLWGNNGTRGYNPKSQHKEQILISCLMTWQGQPPLCFSIFLLCETQREQTQLRCTIQSIKQWKTSLRKVGKEKKEKRQEHVKSNWVALSSATSQNHNTFCFSPERRVRRRLLHNLKLLLQVSSVVCFIFLNPKGQEITHWSWRAGNYLRGMLFYSELITAIKLRGTFCY